MFLSTSFLRAKLWLFAALLAVPACKSDSPTPATTTPTAPTTSTGTVLTGSTFIGEYSAATLAA
ncbi:MAG: hypothetical protein EOO56_27230, partial [Hymenobacter sp.]